MAKKILPSLLPLLMVAHVAYADIDLIAIGQIDGNYQDLSKRTATPLESGVAGNILGGIGSGLAYAGANIFVAMPDRGPNATPYNENLDNTTSFVNRFHTLDLSLAVNPNYNASIEGSMPYILSPQLTATTLLSNSTPLIYGAHATPTINTANKFYYTGRSDGFAPTLNSGNPTNARFDPEGIRVSNDGKSVFLSDEYSPYIYQFNRSSGSFIKSFKLPNYFVVENVRPFEKAPKETTDTGEIAANTIGRTANKGMEGLAITPDGKTLVGIMQANLIQDSKKYLRIVKISIATGKTQEFAYQLSEGSGASEIIAINDHEFLIDERDSKGLGDGSSAVVKKLFKVDLSTGVDISDNVSINAITPVLKKVLFLDIVEKLTANGIAADRIPAKIEGVAFGPDITVAGKIKHTLFVANDNDFLPAVNGVANPNQIFVFSVDEADLPAFLPQKVAPLAIDEHDRG
jgi:hypothetical protein